MIDDFDCRVKHTEALLLSSCNEWGIVLAGDKSVAEADAERLLGYRPGALRSQRDNETCRLPRRQVGNKWRYRLFDLATLIEKEYINA